MCSGHRRVYRIWRPFLDDPDALHPPYTLMTGYLPFRFCLLQALVDILSARAYGSAKLTHCPTVLVLSGDKPSDSFDPSFFFFNIDLVLLFRQIDHLVLKLKFYLFWANDAF